MKTLELNFENEKGTTSKIVLNNPVEPVDAAKISAAMAAIISENIFNSSGGDYVSVKGARLVERNVTDIVLS